MKHVPLCSCAGLGVLSLPDPQSWTKQIQQVSHQSHTNVNLSLDAPPCAKKLRINLNKEWQWARGGLSACLTQFHGCEGGLIVIVESRANIRKMLPISATFPPSLFCAHQGKKNFWPSPEQLILTQFWGRLKMFSLLPKGTLRRWISEKAWTHQPLIARVQVQALATSEAELQEGRYWLLLPLGNTGDRLKSRGKSYFTVSVPWTRKGSWHQQTNQRWKLMRSSFPFSSIILLIFF